MKSLWQLLGVVSGLGIIVSTMCWNPVTWSAPLTFNTALPVAKDEFVSRAQFVLDQSGNDPSGANRDRRVQAGVLALGYGISGNLALFAIVPYVDKDLDITVGGQRQHRSARGLGDISLFGRYTVYQLDWPRRTLRIAPFLGVKAPTGDDDERDALGRLPASVQPGSGSWDTFGGIVATYQTLDFQIDSQLSYRANREANDFELGDEARLDLSLQYRLWPRELGNGLPAFLYGVLETGLIFRDEDQVSGREDPNSGGTTLFVTPGLQYVTKRWIAEAGVSVPMVQGLNGDALEIDYIMRAGLRFNF